jgi:heme A synthase
MPAAVWKAASYGLTADRAWATAIAIIGVIGAVIALIALRRARKGTSSTRNRGTVVSAGLGVIAVAGGIMNLVLADGGPGTGNGVIAGAAAIVTGATACLCSLLARRRTYG